MVFLSAQLFPSSECWSEVFAEVETVTRTPAERPRGPLAEAPLNISILFSFFPAVSRGLLVFVGAAKDNDYHGVRQTLCLIWFLVCNQAVSRQRKAAKPQHSSHISSKGLLSAACRDRLLKPMKVWSNSAVGETLDEGLQSNSCPSFCLYPHLRASHGQQVQLFLYCFKKSLKESWESVHGDDLSCSMFLIWDSARGALLKQNLYLSYPSCSLCSTSFHPRKNSSFSSCVFITLLKRVVRQKVVFGWNKPLQLQVIRPKVELGGINLWKYISCCINSAHAWLMSNQIRTDSVIWNVVAFWPSGPLSGRLPKNPLSSDWPKARSLRLEQMTL